MVDRVVMVGKRSRGLYGVWIRCVGVLGSSGLQNSWWGNIWYKTVFLKLNICVLLLGSQPYQHNPSLNYIRISELATY
jgi:hypothetical protein